MKKIFWLDLEMTGLDVEKEMIIEVGVVITDMDFKTIDTYESVIRQPQKYIDGMDEWNQTHHGDSGLIKLIPSGEAQHLVEEDLCRLVDKHFLDDPPVIAGNSIYQDRKFIDKHMKKFADKLHYRMLDVSSWKVIMVSKYRINHQKTNQHRAIDDVLESIDELKFYLQYFDFEPNFKDFDQ